MTEQDEKDLCALRKTRSKMLLWMVFAAFIILSLSVSFLMMRPSMAAAESNRVQVVNAPAVSPVWDKDGGTPIAYMLNTPSGQSFFCTRLTIKPSVKYSCQPLKN